MKSRGQTISLLLITACAAGIFTSNYNVLAHSFSIDIFFGADSSTALFEDYEGTHQGTTASAGIAYQAGYLTGQALYLADTGQYITYSDTWWAVNAQNYQESGTVECYFKPETFIHDINRGYGLLLHMFERPTLPGVTGYPQFGIFQNGDLSWAISKVTPGVKDYDATPFVGDAPLNPGQWYHLAATWGGGEMKMYINNSLVGTVTMDTNAGVRKEAFQVGAAGTVGGSKGWAPRGWIDRLRISKRPLAAGEFPSALDVRIDSPINGPYTVLRPFSIQYRAYASESRPRVVDLYADTEFGGFNGTLLARDLPESGAVLVGGGTDISDTTYYFYAVARAGNDTAWYYTPTAYTLQRAPGVANVLNPTESTYAATVPSDTVESWTVVLLQNLGTSPSPLVSQTNSTGTGADYAIRFPLMNPQDTVIVHLWTRESSSAMHLSVRRDTASLNGDRLPPFIPNSDLGRRAFGATISLLEFQGAAGTLLGDTKSTSYVGDSFAYTLEYRLSAATAGAFRELGFDTSAGSPSFRFHFADSYGAIWTEDTACTVTVTAGSDGGLIVWVQGLTKDLPGGLGGPGSTVLNATQADVDKICILNRIGAPGPILKFCRFLRENLLTTYLGRLLVMLYYQVGGALS